MSGLDYNKIKIFWDNRPKRVNITGELYVANLSENIPLEPAYRTEVQKDIISKNICLNRNMDVLDLGCGAGRLALFFAQHCRRVVGVDMSWPLLQIAPKNMQKVGLTNVFFVQSSINSFYCKFRFDIIIIAGVLMYLNDNDLQGVLLNIKKMLKKDGKLIVADSVYSKRRRILSEKYTKKWQGHYSVIYRGIKEHKELFRKNNFFLEFEKSISIFPFMGAYHFLLRKLFRTGRSYIYLSRVYFRLIERFIHCAYWYRNTGCYKLMCSVFNKYDHRLFIYTVR